MTSSYGDVISIPGCNKSRNLEMLGKICLRLPVGMLERSDELARWERRSRSAMIREFLEDGIRGRGINHAVELYKRGRVTGWKAASLAGISLRRFYDALEERGVLIQYTERDLEQDLKALRS